MSQILVRPAEASDVDLLARWAVAMAEETEGRALAEETVRRGIALGIADPARARYFVALSSDAYGGAEVVRIPVGTLMLTREWSDWRCGDWWWIQSVYVAPDHRRRGVFRALYAHVEDAARADPQVCGLRLYVEKHNAAAQATYASLGMGDAGYAMYEVEMKRDSGLGNRDR
ncbi:GNAT family N-acetyltransferase [Coralloluteibacterium stylophorae]|uniref:GNAT family N-acetyltransferase n=1 Tax=Coralloluteibacterium stylophorae TaxID=1776034 RepID=A0A8J7VRE6_9GAMM|nr:N-acetyltransferase [Coralloluteibacterium stylophorae]MBS7457393.1 GNAT family N-acetyltransferase [Coralloluteibacterium stylophorae]